MKFFINIIFIFYFSFAIPSIAQRNSPADSLIQLIHRKMSDTSRVLLLEQIAKKIMNSNPQESMKYAKDGLELAEKIDFQKGESRCLNRIGALQGFFGNNDEALKTLFNAINISTQIKDLEGIAKANINLGVIYGDQKYPEKAIECYKKSERIAIRIKNQELLQLSYLNIGSQFNELKEEDSAQFYRKKAYELAVKINSNEINIILQNIGNSYRRQKKYDLALQYYHKSMYYSKKTLSNRTLANTYYEMATVFKATKRLDSCIYYAKKSNVLSKESNHLLFLSLSSRLLASLFENSNPKISNEYYKTAISANDSLFKLDNQNQIKNLTFKQEILQKEFEFAKKELKSKQISAILGSVLGLLLVVSFSLYLLNKNKTKANEILISQKKEIEIHQEEIQKTLEIVKATQKQLILQEKLASLGELTAGIAHEIQNPLNFVNNFSELSIELADELKTEINGGVKDKDLINDILNDLVLNQEKINLHGKRASNIVKNMLEHSRGNTGETSNVNLNKIADDYVRLSFHGMRAKDKSFNSDFELILDPKLPLVKAIDGDLGRVILNIVNNAFYATNNLRKIKAQLEEPYNPKVTIKTIWKEKTLNSKDGIVEVHIHDNGGGIGKKNQEKVFMPFFTTKPTGDGTGLGLSLSNDIITKGHNGTIEIESEEGKGTTFIVKLPIVMK